MNKLVPAILLATGLLNSNAFGQDQARETIKQGNNQKVITGTAFGMYDGTKSAKAQALFDEALNATQQGEYSKAKKLYDKAIKEDPKFVEAYDNVGVVCRKLEKYDEAISYYLKSTELYPEGIMAYQNLGTVYGLQGKHTDAFNAYKRISEIAPEDAEGWFGMANTSLTMQNFSEAVTYAKKALEIYVEEESHHLGDGYHLLGLAHYYNDENEAARKNLSKAKELGAHVHPQVEREVFPSDNESDSGSRSVDLNMKTTEDYRELEPTIVEAYNWYINAPIGANPENRKAIGALLITWLTGTPDVTVEISEELVPYMKCEECLVAFMGAYAKYAIEHKEGTLDGYKANVFATEEVIDFYTNNKKELKKNKKLEEFIEMSKSGKLRAYLKKLSN